MTSTATPVSIPLSYSIPRAPTRPGREALFATLLGSTPRPHLLLEGEVPGVKPPPGAARRGRLALLRDDHLAPGRRGRQRVQR